MAEIIVVDTPGQDNTAAVARQAGARVLISDRPGRAYQMNAGAAVATGEVLYFVHADVHIHPDYVADIQQALDEGYSLGCYRSQFDKPSAALRFNAYCTRFDRIWCRGGDQTLFIPKALFWSLGGYREDHLVMEDYEFILRARRQYAFKIIPKAVVISTRKYLHNSYLRVNLANAVVMSMYFLGYSQQKLIRTYKYLIQVEKYGLSLEKRPASPPLVNHTP
ncbi:rSAM/selenodomain-associated transferase 2 [Rhabdobacter roseus]|uniref:RSAM/selenodomain-associated transferase 2 n=1 Tax=Rhabdobacter roseus TaxID=1655419 RepID=A0A840TGI6_9BACT|nr:rSAM/selenodomain-associated transferase 2 [Rhabdobacter roseus]